MIVGVEGLDGTGKSALIAEMIKLNIMRYVGKHFLDGNPMKFLRGIADKGPHEMRYRYYLLVNLLNATLLKPKHIDDKRAVLVDRTPYSTIAYHKALGVNTDLAEDRLFFTTSPFDKIVYLTAPLKVRAERIQKRVKEGIGTSNKYDEKSIELSEQIDRVFREILPTDTIYLDTSSKEPSVLARQLDKELFA